jgi:acyl carrier protein
MSTLTTVPPGTSPSPEDIERVSALVGRLGNLSGLHPHDDIYDAGFSSIKALELLLELETEFDVTIEDDQFIEARSPGALAALASRLREEQG